MRAAIASLLGSLFGIGLILATHSAQAQGREPTDSTAQTESQTGSTQIRRIGDAALRSLRSSTESLLGTSESPRANRLRLGDSSGEPASSMRWQVARTQGLRSDGDLPRSRDAITLGLQVRF